jgi:hypothetical protein
MGLSDCIVVTAAVISVSFDLLRTMILLGTHDGDVAVRFVLVQTIVALLNVMGNCRVPADVIVCSSSSWSNLFGLLLVMRRVAFHRSVCFLAQSRLLC